MKLKNRYSWSQVFLVGVSLLSWSLPGDAKTSGAGRTRAPSPTTGCVDGPSSFKDTDGDLIPVPFELNRKVELADSEDYLLIGKIGISPANDLYFEVNLDYHPWLAGKRRKDNPIYGLVENSVSARQNWSDYVGKSVKIWARGKWRIVSDENGRMTPVVMLMLLKDPVVTPPALARP